MTSETRQVRALLDRVFDHVTPASRKRIEVAVKIDAAHTLEELKRVMGGSVDTAELHHGAQKLSIGFHRSD